MKNKHLGRLGWGIVQTFHAKRKLLQACFLASPSHQYSIQCKSTAATPHKIRNELSPQTVLKPISPQKFRSGLSPQKQSSNTSQSRKRTLSSNTSVLNTVCKHIAATPQKIALKHSCPQTQSSNIPQQHPTKSGADSVLKHFLLHTNLDRRHLRQSPKVQHFVCLLEAFTQFRRFGIPFAHPLPQLRKFTLGTFQSSPKA